MKKIMYLLLALLLLGGCRSKKSSRTEHREEQKSERKEVKDSSIHVEKTQKVSTFDLQQSQSYEITLESDKDSVEVKSEKRIVKNDKGETSFVQLIKVKGGKAVIKVKNEEQRVKSEADSTLYIDNKISQKTESQSQYTQEAKQVKKEVKTLPLAFIIGALLIGAIALLLWRLKLFR